MEVVIFLCSFLPAIIYCLYFYFNLPYNVVTIKKLLIYFIFGTLSVGLLLTLDDLLPFWGNLANTLTNRFIDNFSYQHVKYFIEVGVGEEFCKLVTFTSITYYLKSLKNPIVNSPTATMVYCGIVALGFAGVENVFYKGIKSF